MTQLIQAIFEKGHLTPITPLALPEHQKVFLAIAINSDNIPSLYISKLAERCESFQFLNNPDEDIYSLCDGKEIK